MLILIFVAALFAFSLSAITGGGASLMVVPLLAQVLSVSSVPAALSIGTGASSVSRIVTFRQHVRWDIARWFVPAAVPMALLGAFTLRYVNPAYIQLLMALALLANLPALFRTQRQPTKTGQSRWAIVGVGAIAGWLSGLTGAVGVLFNGFYLRCGLSKQQIVATRATNEVLIHLVKLATYAALGLVDRETITVGSVVAAAAILASVTLKPLLKRLPHQAFAKLGYAAMVLSGLLLLGSSASRVIEEDRVAFSYRPVLDGIDAKLQWRDASLAIEMELDHGLEIELGMGLSELPASLQSLVHAQDPGADSIMIEAVYGIGQSYYEAYYLVAGNAIKTIAFDPKGRLLPPDGA